MKRGFAREMGAARRWITKSTGARLPSARMGWAVLAMVIAAGSDAPRISVDVEWNAPETCPPRARFEAELRARSSRLRIVEPPEASEAHVSVKVVEKNKKFSAVSKLRTTMSGVTTREFKSAQCETLVQAAALATSMLLDPEGTKLGQVTPAPPPVEGVVDAGMVDVGVIDAGVEPIDAGVVELAVIDAGTVEPIDAGPVVAEVPKPAPVEARRETHLELGAAGGITTAISGLLDGLVQLDVALAIARLRIEVAPMLVIGRRISNALGVAQYFGVGGRLAACLTLPFTSWLRADVGVTLSAFAVPVSAPEAEVPGSAVGLLIAPGALGRLVITFGKFHVALEGSAGVNTRAEAYVVTGSGAVFSAPRFFGSGVVAAGWSL